MTAAGLGNYRIAGQHIGTGKWKKPAAVVAHLGAMQAQDFTMARLGIGIRMAGSSKAQILAAYDSGAVIRTHVLRPTWHLVANADVDWMLRLTAADVLASMRSRHNELGLTAARCLKSNNVLEKTIAASGPQTREELIAALKRAKVTGVPEIYSHLLFRAELDRLICSGPMRGNNITYALYSDRIERTPVLKRDAALAQLAERYFTGHGPATLADFTWWSGLKIGDARTAYAAVANQFNHETIGEASYLIPKTARPAADKVYLLPAFDEFIIGYRDRGAVLAPGMSPKVISNNGIFRATIVANGIVRGIWKREIKKGKFIFKPEYFGKSDSRLRGAVEERAAGLREFWGVG